MIVALDMQLTLGTATGIGEYARGLAIALQRTGTRVIELQEPKLDPWRFDRRIVWDQAVLPQRAARTGADVLHCASGTMPLVRRMPAVVTVHDVAWLRVQQHTRPYARWYFGAFSLQRYKHAAAIAVDSAFSKGELLDVLDVPAERVHVVYPGVAPDFCALERSRDRQPFIFVPGTVERRKNLEILIRALAELPQVRLVSAGPFTPYREQCERLAREAGVASRVEFRGYVDRAQMLRLYAACALVAVPSKYEGFGYAAAQALCAAAPVIVSDRASLPEVVGESAPVIPADDLQAWRDAVSAILRDPGGAQSHADAQRASAIRRFSWDSGASAMNAIYACALQ